MCLCVAHVLLQRVRSLFCELTLCVCFTCVAHVLLQRVRSLFCKLTLCVCFTCVAVAAESEVIVL